MFFMNKMMRYPLKKRKKSLLSLLGCGVIIYIGVQLIFFGDDYSPLQLLSSVESEASRLLRFMTQIQVQCNNSVATNNASMWVLCQDPDFGISENSASSMAIAYSVGPSPDYNFERVVGRNLSYKLHIFTHRKDSLSLLSHISNNTHVYKTCIVPNDPADFGRNSYESQTLNSAIVNLKHKEIDILKLDTFSDSVRSYEVLRFLIEDNVLSKVKELHIKLKLDKVEGDDIYSWYCMLYSLFHKSGFRLYHTSASDPLCLQDTIMESCVYFMSWAKKPPPRVFTMFPPAIDGSISYEEDRMLNFLGESPSHTSHFIYLPLVAASSKVGRDNHLVRVPLSVNLMKRNILPCSIILILSEVFKGSTIKPSSKTNCHIYPYAISTSYGTKTALFTNLSSVPVPRNKPPPRPVSLHEIRQSLRILKNSIMYLHMGGSWEVLHALLNMEALNDLDQLTIEAPIFQVKGKPQPVALRHKYSELKRIEDFGLTLAAYSKQSENNVRYLEDQDVFTLNFVKDIFV